MDAGSRLDVCHDVGVMEIEAVCTASLQVRVSGSLPYPLCLPAVVIFGELSYQGFLHTSVRGFVARTRKGSSNFDLCGTLGYQYLFSQASNLMLRIVQSYSWYVLKLSPRVLNLYESGLWIRQCALG